MSASGFLNFPQLTQNFCVVDLERFDADPDPTFQADADPAPDPDPNPFTKVTNFLLQIFNYCF